MCFPKRVFLVFVCTLFGAIAFAQPFVNSFSPAFGSVGTTVTITGSRFNNNIAGNQVYFGAVKATIIAATNTQLKVTVPRGASQSLISVTANNLTGYSAQPFFVTYAGGGTLTNRSFESAVQFATDIYPYGMSLGDFDNDGKIDAATVSNANVPATYISINKNTSSPGNLSFTPSGNIVIGDNGFDITSADFDGDGKLDLAATFLASSGNVSVFRNTSSGGNISFAGAVTYAAGNSPYTVKAADIDQDGKPDLVICNFTGNAVSILKNTSVAGSISFAPRIELTTALAPFDLAVADFDGDGKIDIVTSNQLSNNVSVFRNTSTTGTISFANRLDLGTGISPMGIATGDLDGDNKPEIAFVNSAEQNLSVLRNTSSPGSLSFADGIKFPLSNYDAVGPRRIAIADLDADKKPELIATGSNVYLLKNKSNVGTVSFEDAVTYFVYSPYRIDVADLDTDGLPDLAVSNVSDKNFSVFRNKVPLPQLNSLTQTIAAFGQVIPITGYNLTGTTSLSFGDEPAASFVVNNANSISATIGQGASGYVKVTTPYGSDSVSGFVFAGPPIIYSIAPLSATTGDTVTITGQNFSETSTVEFGGTAAASLVFVSPHTIKAVVGAGSSGDVKLTTTYGFASFEGFSYLAIPIVNSFEPTIAAAGTTVTISGINFTNISSVSFGGVAASSFTVVSPNTIQAVVDNGASGNVKVTNNFGNGTLGGFTFIPAPIITSFTPTATGSGKTVTINGSHFIGTRAVKFGDVPAFSFEVVSDSVITAVVNYGASGKLSVTNAGGTTSLDGFTFVPAPAVTSFTPKITGEGGVITISGNHFSGANAVTIGGAPATSFTVVDSTTITAIVGKSASGLVEVTTVGGTGSLGGFDFTIAPVINSFLPTSGGVGTVVTITGANFDAVAANNIVYLGGVKAVVSSATKNTLHVTVPAGASNQPITVTTSGRLAQSTKPFLITFSGGQFTPNAFANRADFVTSGNPESIATGDLDGDGKPDVVVANTASNSISFFRNTSTGGDVSFDSKIDSAAGPYPHAIKIADIDADGKPDVLLLNYNRDGSENTITIFRNESTPGNLSFRYRYSIQTYYRPQDLVVVDLNLDGKPDLAVAFNGITRGGHDFISVYMNNGSPGQLSFSQNWDFNASPEGSGFFGNSIVAADMDNDEKPDLVVGFGYGGFMTVLKNESPVGYEAPMMRNNCFGSCWFGFGYSNLAIADFDSDGKLDVITDNYILRNITSNAMLFETQRKDGIGGIAATGNFSGGLKPDFVRVNPDNQSLSLLKNSSNPGSIGFDAAVNYPTGSGPKGIAAADFNGDGKLDVAITNYNFNTFSVLLNGVGSNDPAITSISPDSGTAGTVVTITGSNFSNITDVRIGGVAAASFTVVNSTTITAVAGNGTSGNVSVTSAGQIASAGWFYFAPTIASISPDNAGKGVMVTITGTNLTGSTAVSFGGVPASFTVLSPTTIVAFVGDGASGDVNVTTPGGTATFSGFTYVAKPVITDFSPELGGMGTVVTITGNNFTGATQVTFGGGSASSFTVVSPDTITAVVGNGYSGNVMVTTPGGTTDAINKHFAFYSTPFIKSITPNNGTEGSTISIVGSNFPNATEVSFGGVSAASFSLVNDSTITAVVGNGASGDVMIKTLGGTATFPGFTFSLTTAVGGVNTTTEQVTIFPNPSRVSITVYHPASTKRASIQLTDMYGRVIRKTEVGRNTTKTQMAIQDLATGIYRLTWSDGKRVLSGSFLKQ